MARAIQDNRRGAPHGSARRSRCYLRIFKRALKRDRLRLRRRNGAPRSVSHNCLESSKMVNLIPMPVLRPAWKPSKQVRLIAAEPLQQNIVDVFNSIDPWRTFKISVWSRSSPPLLALLATRPGQHSVELAQPVGLGLPLLAFEECG
jgi:hypothetical protein